MVCEYLREFRHKSDTKEVNFRVFFVLAGDEKASGVVNLYPSYVYSGNLRPYPQSAKRTVPASIERPDYADHPEGRSISEEKMRGKQLFTGENWSYEGNVTLERVIF